MKTEEGKTVAILTQEEYSKSELHTRQQIQSN
jgi:hypothetical protein